MHSYSYLLHPVPTDSNTHWGEQIATMSNTDSFPTPKRKELESECFYPNPEGLFMQGVILLIGRWFALMTPSSPSMWTRKSMTQRSQGRVHLYARPWWVAVHGQSAVYWIHEELQKVLSRITIRLFEQPIQPRSHAPLMNLQSFTVYWRLKGKWVRRWHSCWHNLHCGKCPSFLSQAEIDFRGPHICSPLLKSFLEIPIS